MFINALAGGACILADAAVAAGAAERVYIELGHLGVGRLHSTGRHIQIYLLAK